jgi:hypothetical protein
MSKRPRPEMMDEQIPATRQRVSRRLGSKRGPRAVRVCSSGQHDKRGQPGAAMNMSPSAAREMSTTEAMDGRVQPIHDQPRLSNHRVEIYTSC